VFCWIFGVLFLREKNCGVVVVVVVLSVLVSCHYSEAKGKSSVSSWIPLLSSVLSMGAEPPRRVSPLSKESSMVEN